MRTRTVKSGRYLYTPDAPNRFIRCQHCGFICDTTRDTNRANPTTFSDVTYVICMENGYEELITERSLMYEYIYLETTQLYGTLTDEHGNEILTEPSGAEYTRSLRVYSMPVELEAGVMPGFFEVSSGCPFCGAEYTRSLRV